MQLPVAESYRARFINVHFISYCFFSSTHTSFRQKCFVLFLIQLQNKNKTTVNVFLFFYHFPHLTGVWDNKFHCIECPSRTRPDVFMFTTHYFGIACQNKVSLGKSECECFHASGLQCLCWSRQLETMWF